MHLAEIDRQLHLLSRQRNELVRQQIQLMKKAAMAASTSTEAPSEESEKQTEDNEGTSTKYKVYTMILACILSLMSIVLIAFMARECSRCWQAIDEVGGRSERAGYCLQLDDHRFSDLLRRNEEFEDVNLDENARLLGDEEGSGSGFAGGSSAAGGGGSGSGAGGGGSDFGGGSSGAGGGSNAAGREANMGEDNSSSSSSSSTTTTTTTTSTTSTPRPRSMLET